ncbi:hypothetical protein ERJ75_000122000 [Trypanosoma vivax]|nr:hypothetical protein ERJ75_000122000 [Trypanosoma vivax]
MAPHPPDVVPTVEEHPKGAREEDATDDGNTLKCPWRAKKYAAHAWLRKHMVQKHPEKQLLSGTAEAEDTLGSDGEAVQEEQEGICVPAAPSRPQEQNMAHQPQVRSNLYYKLGRLERGGAACQ